MPSLFASDSLFKKGLRVRKAVLGGEHVSRRISEVNQYTQMFDEMDAAAKFAAKPKRKK